jgi:hypothetical protein
VTADRQETPPRATGSRLLTLQPRYLDHGNDMTAMQHHWRIQHGMAYLTILLWPICANCHLIYPFSDATKDGSSDGPAKVVDAQQAKDRGGNIDLRIADVLLSPDHFPSCGPAGIASQECASEGRNCCNPLVESSCPEGACYLQFNAPACVCPVGKTATGQACTIATECQPKHACIALAGQLTGICVRLCQADEQCPAPALCNTDQLLWGFGVCL